MSFIIKHGELVRKCISKGYTLRANINPGLVRMFNKALKIKGAEVAKAIKANETKKAINLIIEAQRLKKNANEGINELIEKGERVVYNSKNQAIWYHYRDDKLVRLEIMEEGN